MNNKMRKPKIDKARAVWNGMSEHCPYRERPLMGNARCTANQIDTHRCEYEICPILAKAGYTK